MKTINTSQSVNKKAKTKIRILFTVLYVVSFFSQTIISQNSRVKKDVTLSINHVAIDAFSNTLNIYCNIENKSAKNLVDDTSKFNLNIKHGDSIFYDVVIKKINTVTESTFILNVKPPLGDAIYRTEKRVFTLRYTTKDTVAEAKKSVILGSFIKTYDLRPYISNNSLNMYMACFYVFLIITCILMLLTPLSNKFKFKKLYIKKYSNVKSEEEDGLISDPFTYVPIEDIDEVVKMGDKIMLLSSWKRLNKLPESKTTKEYLELFEERLQGTFFKPKTDQLKRINSLWFKVIGVFLGWILFSVIINNKHEFYINSLARVFDSKSFQASSIIASNLLLGSVLSLFYGGFSEISKYLHDKKKKTQHTYIRSALTRALMVFSAFFICAVINSYIFQNYYLTSLIDGLLITFSMLLPTNFKTIKKAQCIPIIISGSLAYCFYLIIIQIEPKTNSLNTMLPLLFFLLSTLILGEITLHIVKKRYEISKSLKKINIPKLNKSVKKAKTNTLKSNTDERIKSSKENYLSNESSFEQKTPKEKELTR